MPTPIPSDAFQVPIFLDVVATFLYALVGTRFAIMRGYDVIGVFVLSVVASTGGGLLRDIVLGVGTPMVLTKMEYLASAWSAALVGLVVHRYVPKINSAMGIVDAMSIGMYSIVGAQKALLLGLNPLAALFVGFINATGGGILRDILVRNEPDVFRPGAYFAVAILVGLVAFLTLVHAAGMAFQPAAVISVVCTVSTRMLALKFGWKTRRLG